MEAHPTIIDKAAAVGCGLMQNHGFVDGNKSIGVTALLLILRRNGVEIAYTQEELVQVGLDVAQGLQEVPQVVEWIKLHTKA